MNNQVEFIVKMRDLMGGAMNRLASTSQSSFNRMAQGANLATSRNQILGMSFNEIQKAIAQTESKIKSSTIPSQIAAAKRELESLQRMSDRHPGSMGGAPIGKGGGIGIGGIAVGGMLGGLATQGIGMIMNAVSDSIGAVVSESVKKEQAITGLTTFLGKQGAQDAYKNIRQDANSTPYDTASLLEVNRSLISAGANAKDARRDTMNLANAVSAVGGGNDILSRMAANMQQIKTVGKATSMDIRQFGIAGINIYEMLARSTGKNINQVKEMDVTYEQLAAALAKANSKGGIYEGAMAAQSQTMGGKWSTVKDNFMTAASDIGDAFSPVFNKLLDLGIKFANSIPAALEAAKPYIDIVSGGVGQIVDFVMSIVNGTSDWSGWVEVLKGNLFSMWETVSMIGVKLWNLVSSIIDFVKHSQILKDIFKFVGWIFSEVGHTIGILIDQITWIWDNILKPILEGLDMAYKWITGNNDVSIKSTKTIIAPKKADEKASAFSENKKLADTNAASGKEVGASIVGGGTKTVNINLGKFFDTIQFTTMNGTESAAEMEKVVMECLARVLYQGSKVV